MDDSKKIEVMSVDDLYKEELQEKTQKKLDEAKEKKEVEETISKWIKEGKELIFPERHEKWEKEIRTYATYDSKDVKKHGRNIGIALEILKKIKKGTTPKEVVEILRKYENKYQEDPNVNIFGDKLLGDNYITVYGLLYDFSKIGPELADIMRPYTEDDYNIYYHENVESREALRKENKKLIALHNSNKNIEANSNKDIQAKVSNLQDTIKEKEERVKILIETLETINSLEQRNSELDKQIEELVNKINGRQL